MAGWVAPTIIAGASLLGGLFGGGKKQPSYTGAPLYHGGQAQDILNTELGRLGTMFGSNVPAQYMRGSGQNQSNIAKPYGLSQEDYIKLMLESGQGGGGGFSSSGGFGGGLGLFYKPSISNKYPSGFNPNPKPSFGQGSSGGTMFDLLVGG